jgi:predicted anti-sigma-YlaC factor YlaD
MHIDADRHIDEEIAERYAMRSLARDEAALVEEHLLVCETCRNRVTEADAYVRAMESAVPRLPVKAAKSHWNFGQ